MLACSEAFSALSIKNYVIYCIGKSICMYVAYSFLSTMTVDVLVSGSTHESGAS